MLVFGVQLSPLTVLAFPVLLLQGILVASAAVWTSSRVANIGQLNHFNTLFLSPQFMFAGVFFPVDSLPAWAQVVAWLLPLSHSVSVLRSITQGTLDWETLAHLAWLCLVATVLFVFALRSMRARLVR
jgi:lipooligosaccharide transport system permease protein